MSQAYPTEGGGGGSSVGSNVSDTTGQIQTYKLLELGSDELRNRIKNDVVDDTHFFRFKLVTDTQTWVVPITVSEDSLALNFQSAWEKTNVMGTTEGMTAYNYTDNVTLPINFKVHEDLWEYCMNVDLTDSHNATQIEYLKTLDKLASLVYPIDTGSYIKAPYCYIGFDNYVFRGYFTSIRISPTGPLRNGHRVAASIAGSFTVVRSNSPSSTQLANSNGNGILSYFYE